RDVLFELFALHGLVDAGVTALGPFHTDPGALLGDRHGRLLFLLGALLLGNPLDVAARARDLTPHPVVLVALRLLRRREVPAGLEPGRVLDHLLGEGDTQVLLGNL